MTIVKYSLLAIFTIALIINAWIFLTSNSSEETTQTKEVEVAENQLYNQLPKDNDAEYSMPAYIPTHSQSMPRTKVEFKEGADNDALYSMPVSIPTEPPPAPAPVKAATKAPAKNPEKVIFAPEEPIAIPVRDTAPAYQQPQAQVAEPAPVAPLQPRARQPETPTYVPQYQQQQVEQPQYQQPAPQAQQQPDAKAVREDELYPYYYY